MPYTDNAIVILAAFVLDALAGEFRNVPHPVQFFGLIIGAFERLFNRDGVSAYVRKGGGVVMVMVVAAAGYAVPLLIIRSAYTYLPAWAGFGVSALLAYTALSMRGLGESAMSVLRPLRKGDLESARKSLSMIVGRDTVVLDERGITRAAVETVAENSSDGVVAPIFYMAIGGVPLAFMYKAINTMDSMVGYRDRKYRDFGWAAARLDDLANFIPARITALYMILAAWVLSWFRKGRYSASGAVDIMFRDRLNHKSPNSGYPESAMAGALGVRLGGPSSYFGIMTDKPFIGDESNPLDAGCIVDSVRLLYLTGAFAALDLAFLSYLIRLLGG